MGEKSARSFTFSGGRFSACGSVKFMRLISSAERTKDNEFKTKTVLRPKYAASTPPIATPIAKLNDQVVVESVFATVSSDSPTRFGIAALRPGSNSAQRIVSMNK